MPPIGSAQYTKLSDPSDSRKDESACTPPTNWTPTNCPGRAVVSRSFTPPNAFKALGSARWRRRGCRRESWRGHVPPLLRWARCRGGAPRPGCGPRRPGRTPRPNSLCYQSFSSSPTKSFPWRLTPSGCRRPPSLHPPHRCHHADAHDSRAQPHREPVQQCRLLSPTAETVTHVVTPRGRLTGIDGGSLISRRPAEDRFMLGSGGHERP